MEENNKKILKIISENLIIIIAVILYLAVINFSFFRLSEELIYKVTQFTSMAMLILSIIIFEIAYNKDSGKLAINGIELLILAIHSLTIWNIIYKNKISFGKYITFTSIFCLAYYIFKLLILYTRERKEYADSLSDIHEIVQSEPIKKEAKKRENS